jgi:hypothetical protein
MTNKVRAKFKLNSYKTSLYSQNGKTVELRTLEFSPPYSNDPNSENGKFFNATPYGKIELGTVNPEAWKQFELGKEYYIDFVPAE